MKPENTPQIHFVCIGGCGLVSEVQTKCNSIGCWRARNPLAECDCTDGKHKEFYEIYNPSMLEENVGIAEEPNTDTSITETTVKNEQS